MSSKRNKRRALQRIAGPRTALLLGTVIIAIIIGVLFMQQKGLTPGTSDGQDIESNANPLKDLTLYVTPDSNAAKQATAWRNTRPNDAATLDKLAAEPTARWLTTGAALDTLAAYVDDAASKNAVPVLVTYNIPFRDCGRYSAGGAGNEQDYKQFIDSIAGTIGNKQAIIILEPDALAGVEGYGDNGKPCLDAKQRQQYYTLLGYAIDKLKENRNTHVYIDAGNSAWDRDAAEMARRLRKANVTNADGFSLNISNFQTNVETIAYGNEISAKVHGKHFVIDTSRNGLGPFENKVDPAYNWCNPPARALGHFPTTSTDHPLVDAFLYIKYPGESDGADPDTNKCFGGPAAGTWWPEYAVGLIERWPENLQR